MEENQMAIRHESANTRVTRIVVEPPSIVFTGPVRFDAPDAARLLAHAAEQERHHELRRLLELGAQTAETIGTSTTLRLVEAQITAMATDLNTKLGGLLVKERAEALKSTKELLDDHRVRFTASVTRYLDPESQASLPVVMTKVFDAAAESLLKRVGKLLDQGDDSALGRLADRFTKELDQAVALLIEQMAARHALTTRSALAGRPYEDAVEERLLAFARPLGDKVTRSGDTLGLLRRRAGDMIVSLAPESVRGRTDVRIVVEAKRRGAEANAFSSQQIEASLATAQRNRAAAGGIYVVESANALPLGLGFQEVNSKSIAVAFDPAGDDIALAVAYRLVRLAVIRDSLGAGGEEIDRETYSRVVSDIRIAMGKLNVVRAQHQAALNCITKAASAVNDLDDAVLRGLRQVDDLMGV
jgi:hypothetical protein